ncbi:hypothetical protein ACU4GD_17825 [Cupriavidus basilensis]
MPMILPTDCRTGMWGLFVAFLLGRRERNRTRHHRQGYGGRGRS